jgi:hypothetical protein
MNGQISWMKRPAKIISWIKKDWIGFGAPSKGLDR